MTTIPLSKKKKLDCNVSDDINHMSIGYLFAISGGLGSLNFFVNFLP